MLMDELARPFIEEESKFYSGASWRRRRTRWERHGGRADRRMDESLYVIDRSIPPSPSPARPLPRPPRAPPPFRVSRSLGDDAVSHARPPPRRRRRPIGRPSSVVPPRHRGSPARRREGVRRAGFDERAPPPSARVRRGTTARPWSACVLTRSRPRLHPTPTPIPTPTPTPTRTRTLGEVLLALEHLHANAIAFRDLKPEVDSGYDTPASSGYGSAPLIRVRDRPNQPTCDGTVRAAACCPRALRTCCAAATATSCSPTLGSRCMTTRATPRRTTR